jgi:putative flippase GtrA
MEPTTPPLPLPSRPPGRGLFDIAVLRYLVVGVMNTAFAYSVYALLLWMQLPYWAANVGAALLGILFSFRTQGALVFKQTAGSRFPRFVIAWLAILAVQTVLLGALIRLGLNAYTAGIVALVPVTLLSYFVQRCWVFR